MTALCQQGLRISNISVVCTEDENEALQFTLKWRIHTGEQMQHFRMWVPVW